MIYYYKKKFYLYSRLKVPNVVLIFVCKNIFARVRINPPWLQAIRGRCAFKTSAIPQFFVANRSRATMCILRRILELTLIRKNLILHNMCADFVDGRSLVHCLFALRERERMFCANYLQIFAGFVQRLKFAVLIR